MRLLIASTKQRLAGYTEFVEALGTLGVETVCVQDVNYYALSEFTVLNHVPFPKMLKLIKRFNPNFILTNLPYYTSYIAKLVDRCPLLHLRETCGPKCIGLRRFIHLSSKGHGTNGEPSL